jgi:trimeric autotransporter adhesin
MKKKAVKIAAATAVAASAFVATAPQQSEAANSLAVEVSVAVTAMKQAYHTYSDVTATGKFADINAVYADYNAAKAAYNKAKGLVEKSKDAKKDAYLAELEATYADYIAKRVVTYIDAYNYATINLEANTAALKAAIEAKDAVKVEAVYHEISKQLKTRTVILDRVYGESTRDLFRNGLKKAAQDLRDTMQYDVTVGMALRDADAAVKAGKFEDAKKALDKAAEFLPKTTTFKAELTAANAVVVAAYDAVQTPKVDSVSATNLKNIVVKFNTEVNDKTVVSSNVKVFDGTTLLTGVALNLADDNKTLLITNNGSYSQNKEYKVVVENVEKKGDATKKVAAEQAVTVIDTTLPTVESVTVTSPKTVEIVFSEPVQTGSGSGQFPTSASVLTNIVQIDGINAYATPDVTKVNTSNKVTLTLNTGLTAGDHKIKVAGLNDFANLPITAKEFTVNIPVDTAAPEATTVTVLTKDKVKVTFNEPVDNASVQANLANIKVNGTAVTGAAIKDGGKAYELTLGASLNLGAVVESTLSYKGVKDNYGNTVTEAKTIKFTATDDTAAPTVADVKVNTDNTIEVTFSESVTGFDAASTVELYDKDNKKVANTVSVAKKVIDGVASDKVYVLTITSGISLSGAHSIKLLADKATDLSIRTNKLAEATFPVVLNDKTAPTVSKVEFVNEAPDFNSDSDTYDAKATIFFSEAMDAATITNKANFLLGGVPLADVSGATLTAGSDNKSVTLTINRSTSGTAFTFSTGTDLRLIAVKDAAGNTLTSGQVNANLGSGGANLISQFNAAPTFGTAVATVEAISANQLKVTSQHAAGYLFTAVDANKVKFVDGSGDLLPGLQVTGVTVAADGKTATLTLNNNVSSDVKFDDASDSDITVESISVFADAGAFTLTNGAKTDALVSGFAVSVTDKVAPELKTVTRTQEEEITLTFTEGVSFGSSDEGKYEVKLYAADGTPMTLVSGSPTAAGQYSINVSNAALGTVTISVYNSVTAADTFSVKITDPVFIKDTSGNTNKLKSTESVTVKAYSN